MFKKINKTKALYYIGFSLLIAFFFLLQVKTSFGTNKLFPILYLIIFFLVSEVFRRKILEKVLAREQYFRTLVNANLQPIIIRNKKGKIIFISESIKELIGIKNEGKFRDLADFVHPQDSNIYKGFTEHILKWPNERKSVEFRLKRNDDWIWVRHDAINLLNNNNIKAIIGSIQDVTTQKSIDREKVEIIENEKVARSMAEKAIRNRDEFLSIASHELKTPLTTVLLQLQATLRKISTQSLADFSGADLLNSLKIAEKQSQSLATLIKDLLNVSLASTGKITLNKEKVNLSTLTESLVKKYGEEINISGCQVKTIIQNNEIIGEWDLVRIEQAITNLFLNALKYAEGKKVTITLFTEDNWAIFEISDEGNGIPEEMQKQIFEPFKRADNGPKIKGLGVGLFIAKQIINAHGGDIGVKSEVGKGATFVFKLPL